MTARMRRATLAALATGLLLAPAGCGVPADTAPVAVGQAPGVGEPAERTDARLPEPNGAGGPKELVQRFLQAAAAGDWGPVRGQRLVRAADYLRTFLKEDVGRAWQPKPYVLVVDVVSTTVGVNTVNVVLKPVGTLNEYGAVDVVPSGTPSLITQDFNVERDAKTEEWRITTAPPQDGLLLSTDGLASLYSMRPIYFWDNSDRYLVPDPRYLAKGISREKRVREVVDRLLRGPSTWLEQVVLPLPAGTNMPDNPVLHDNQIDVNLSEHARNDRLRLKKITWQLRWSLHPLTLPVELQIDNRPEVTDSGLAYRDGNPATLTGNNEDQRLYGVVGGKAVPVKAVSAAAPVLAAAENANVVSAAVRRDGKTAALVRGGKAPELWLGRYAGETSGAKYEKSSLTCAAVSRPALLAGPQDQALVACDGRLWVVGPGTSAVRVALGNEADGAVKALSAAPDGRRLAVVTSDKVYVTTLTVGTAQVNVGTLREVYAGGLTRLSGVAWSSEYQLAVAGTVPGTGGAGNSGGTSGLVEVSIDNASRSTVTASNAGLVITAVTAVPRDPVSNISQPITVEAGGQAYYVFASNVVAVKRETPATDPSPSPATGAGPPLSAPFYLE